MTTDVAAGDAPAVTTRREGRVAWITLNRPAKANVIGLATARAFRDAVDGLAAEPPSVVVLAAEGKVFCAGGDVFEMSASADLSAYLAQAARDLHAGLRTLRVLEPIVIAAVDGAAAGAGLGLALTADVVVATDRARFLTAYEQVGLTPDGGTSYWLPRVVGPARATAMSVSSAVLDAETAQQWGIVSQIVAPAELHDTVNALARRIADAGTAAALVGTRRLYGGDDHEGYAEHLDLEARTLAGNATRPATVALIAAFVERERARRERAGALDSKKRSSE